jgi:broad specificity phosphatase PhoE
MTGGGARNDGNFRSGHITRIVLIRHGQTDWNVEQRSQGWNDQPLNALGLQQAALLGRHVRERFKFIRVWSSDLSRCAQTAEQIGLPFEPTPMLRELQFGAWEGRLWPELHHEAPDVAAKFSRGDPTFRAPGGESLGELVVRAGRFVEESGIGSAEGDVAVVSHGGTLRSLIVRLLKLPPESVGRFHCANASISIIASAPGTAGAPGLTRLESLNETAHLNSL